MKKFSMDPERSVVERIKNFFHSRLGEFAVLASLTVLSLLFTLIFYSIHFTEYTYQTTNRGDMSFWSEGILPIESNSFYYLYPFGKYFVIAFIAGLVIDVCAIVALLFKKVKPLFYAAPSFNILLSLVCLITGVALKILRGSAIACCLISILISISALAIMIYLRKAKKRENEIPEKNENTAITFAENKKYKPVLLITLCVALLALFSVMFTPLYLEENPYKAYSLISSLASYDYPVYISIAFILIFIALFAEIICFASTLSTYNKDKVFIKKSKQFITGTAIFTLFFFVLGYCLTFYFNLSNKDPKQSAYTVSYIPFILSIVTLIFYSVLCGKMRIDDDADNSVTKRAPLKLEPLFEVLAITAVTFLTLALNIITIHIDAGALGQVKDVSLSGYQLLNTYPDLESGFQAMAFIEFAFLLSSGVLLALTAVSYFAKDKGYYSLVKTTAFANFIFVLILGLFGIYFSIAQKINIENLKSILDHFGWDMPDYVNYDVTSQTIYLLIASFAVLVLMLCRKIFNLSAEPSYCADNAQADVNLKNNEKPSSATSAESGENTAKDSAASSDFDACPAFTELDSKQALFRETLENRRQFTFANPALPALVRFVVDYARECRLHLSYSPEDIATFVAGLGASRLAILQGMSGTGKTSLPKIFTEALMGNCEIVEVESSWRDKNELLGYYNEFSKCFTPKKFTQCLYKARLNPSVPTFIVLDEMNLSRIEYYFSDFLSLMENEEDKREIKLLNVKLFRTENGQKITYDGLTDGHTIKIPANVWFIGTANRDESTFEISDKVYDRAQTMNFNKRAPKIHSFGTPLPPKFVTYDVLINLLEEAKNSYSFEAESNELVKKTEKILAKYNVSFGNRILKQMEDFVKIYCACFGDKSAVENDAVEKILLSKVVSKLESKVVENKESLAKEFDKLGLKRCGEFVRKLNED